MVIVTATVVYRRLTRVKLKPPDEAGMLLVGSPLSLPLDWTSKKQTLLMAIDDSCPHCTESGSLYQRLAAEASKNGTYTVVLVKGPVDQARIFLRDNSVTVNDVRQVSFEQVGLFAVPAFICVDSHGIIRGIWVGALDTNEESDLVERLRNTDGGDHLTAESRFVQVADLKKALGNNVPILLLDVDERTDYSSEHILNAINIPFDELDVRARQELDPSQKTVVYCRCDTDGTSRLAAKILYRSGFKDVLILRGGLDAWRADQ